jgi:DNA-binding FadR family transcriptional regulator
MPGLSRDALGPVLSRLERDGLVHRRHGRVELRDRARMQQWVDMRTMRPS